MLYISIFLYFLFAFLMVTLGRAAYTQDLRHYGRSNDRFTAQSFLIVLVFATICGFRYRVGVDCESYAMGYLLGSYERNFDIEPLFKFISQTLRNLGASRVVFLGIWAFLQAFFVYYSLRNRKYLYAFVGWSLILGPFFLSWMNGVRQIVAATLAFFVWQFVLDKDKKTFKTLLIGSGVLAIGALIHQSVLVLLPILIIAYFSQKLEFCKNRLLCISILIACSIIGQTSNIKGYLSPVQNILFLFEDYGGYAENFDTIVNVDRFIAYGPRRIVQLIMAVIILWYYPEIKKTEGSYFFSWSINLFFIQQCIGLNLLSNMSSLMYRPFMYCEPFSLFCYAYTLWYLYKCRKRNPLIFLFALVVSGSYTILDNIASKDILEEASLLKFIFLKY